MSPIENFKTFTETEDQMSAETAETPAVATAEKVKPAKSKPKAAQPAAPAQAAQPSSNPAAVALRELKAESEAGGKGKSNKAKSPKKETAEKKKEPEAPTVVVNEKSRKRSIEAPVLNVPLADIDPSTQTSRAGHGDIDALRDSINSNGLFQPIVIGYKYGADGSRLFGPNGEPKYDLLAGGRRYRAVHALKWPTVPAMVHTFDGESDPLVRNLQRQLVEAEENARRVNPTLAEKLALAEKIQAILGTPEGKKVLADSDAGQYARRHYIAQATGLSHEAQRQAKLVQVAAAAPGASEEVKKAAAEMLSAAAPKAKINAAFKVVMKQVQLATDGEDYPITPEAAAIFTVLPSFKAMLASLKAAAELMTTIGNSKGGERLKALARTNPDLVSVRTKEPGPGETSGITFIYTSPLIDRLKDVITQTIPHSSCPACAVKAGKFGVPAKDCVVCGSVGWVTEPTIEALSVNQPAKEAGGEPQPDPILAQASELAAKLLAEAQKPAATPAAPAPAKAS